jgi:hypothetical protein
VFVPVDAFFFSGRIDTPPECETWGSSSKNEGTENGRDLPDARDSEVLYHQRK